MDSVNSVIRDLFIMGVLLILVVYYVGSTSLAKTVVSGANTLDLTATGRNANGVFANYPGTGAGTGTGG